MKLNSAERALRAAQAVVEISEECGPCPALDRAIEDLNQALWALPEAGESVTVNLKQLLEADACQR